jgi:hypothetical protein
VFPIHNLKLKILGCDRQHPKVVEDKNFYVSTNEVLSLTVKTTGVSPINKEAQLFAMSLDNQGGT